MTKKELRPILSNALINSNMSALEQFQNSVLRPVIKLQHSLIIALFNKYLTHANFNTQSLNNEQIKEFIRTSISKNQHLKNQYIGLISGMFTKDEFEHYLSNSSEYGKRIIQMIIQRLQDTLIVN